MINKRISDLSCNKEEFDKVKSVYESVDIFYQCLIIAVLKTLEEIETGKLYGSIHHIAKMRKQIFVNCSSSLWGNTSPKNNRYHKIFNLNTFKLSYCCTTNVGNIIKQHNSKVLSKTNDNNNRKCNCRSKPNRPLNGECLTQYLVYKAASTTSRNSFVYYGTSEGEFKIRYNNHTKSFRHRECMNETELSKHVWNLKDHGPDNNLSWEIHKKASPYQCGSKRCNLCLPEKASIICVDPDTLLNKRTELISKCSHKN